MIFAPKEREKLAESNNVIPEQIYAVISANFGKNVFLR